MHAVALAVLTILPAFSPSEPAQAFDMGFDKVLVHASLQSIVMDNAIAWKVGDTSTYRFSIGRSKGSMVQSVTQDDGNTIWMRQAFKIANNAQTIDIQLTKADGSVVKVLQDGEEVDAGEGDDALEIVSADEARITVPAGTFDCLHVVARTGDGQKLESWNNDVDTVMDGTIKQVIGTDMGNMVFELLSFKHGS